MKKKGADRGSSPWKIPANTLLRAPASAAALALIYRGKLQRFLDGMGIAQWKIQIATQRVLSWLEDLRGSLPKVTQEEKRDTMKEERMQKYTEGRATDDKEH